MSCLSLRIGKEVFCVHAVNKEREREREDILSIHWCEIGFLTYILVHFVCVMKKKEINSV